MIDPTFKTDGFGFVFPRGSPLVPDISRAILNVTEGDTMEQIENAWFGEKNSCPDSGTSVSSVSLDIESFWGLFLIAGVAASLALIIFSAMFLYEHRHVVLRSDPEASMWRRFVAVLKSFDKKDLGSHTFKNSEPEDRNDMHSVHGLFATEASPGFNFQTSPSGYSHQTGVHFVFFGEQGAAAAGFADPSPNGEASPELVPGTIELIDLIFKRDRQLLKQCMTTIDSACIFPHIL